MSQVCSLRPLLKSEEPGGFTGCVDSLEFRLLPRFLLRCFSFCSPRCCFCPPQHLPLVLLLLYYFAARAVGYPKMKAVTPVHPQDSSSSSSSSSSGGSQLSLHYLSKQSLNIARCRMEEEDLFCLQYDMNDCYSRLKRLVPTIPQDKKVSKVEILQHVIDYILDLQLALETHPSLQKQQPQRTCPPAASNPSRTPLTVLNIDHHQRPSIVKKPEDSVLCR